jgi:hypothetical protein
MNPKVIHAQRACEAAKARQAVVVFIDEVGQYAVASYGETKAECAAVKPLCNAIHEAIHEGLLPVPGDSPRSSKAVLEATLADHETRLRALEATQRSAQPYCPYRDHPAHNTENCAWCRPATNR